MGRLVLLIPLLAGLSTELQAREKSCVRRSVFVSVLNKDGNTVGGLTATHFRATFRKQPVQIHSAEVDAAPRRIVLLLDVSNSMVDRGDKWNAALMAAMDVVSLAPRESSIALLTFRTKVEGRIDFTRDRKALTESLLALRPQWETLRKSDLSTGRTALLDSILEGLAQFDPPGFGDVIYAITDGVDNVSRSRLRQVEEALLSSGVRVFAFLVHARGPYHPPEVSQGVANLLRIVEVTGGNWLNPFPAGHTEIYAISEERRAALALATQWLCRQMGEFYRLEVELPQEVDKARDWKLEVVDNQGNKRRDVKIIYPSLFLPCGKENSKNHMEPQLSVSSGASWRVVPPSS